MSNDIYVFNVFCCILICIRYYGKDFAIGFFNNRFNRVIKQIIDLNNKNFFSKLDLNLIKEDLKNTIIKHKDWEQFAQKKYEEVYDQNFNKFQKQLNAIKEFNKKSSYILKINKQRELIDKIFEKIKNEQFWKENSIDIEKFIDFIN